MPVKKAATKKTTAKKQQRSRGKRRIRGKPLSL